MNNIEEFQYKLIELLKLHERGYKEHAIRSMWELSGLKPVEPIVVPDYIRKAGCPKS